MGAFPGRGFRTGRRAWLPAWVVDSIERAALLSLSVSVAELLEEAADVVDE